MQNIVTLKNDFHETEVRLRCRVLDHGSEVTIRPGATQIARAKRVLCGISGCTCSDDTGCRGLQTHRGKRLLIELQELPK